MLLLQQVIGLLFILYGLVKLGIFISLITIPKHIQKDLSKIPGVSIVVTGDHTMAGRGLDYVIALFAVFSLIHGCALLGFLPNGVDSFIESHLFQYSFYILCGLSMIIFYTLVLYSDLPITKDPNRKKDYIMYGYVIGTIFLVIPVVWHFIIVLYPLIHKMPVRKQLMFLTALIFIVFGIVYGIYQMLPTGHRL